MTPDHLAKHAAGASVIGPAEGCHSIMAVWVGAIYSNSHLLLKKTCNASRFFYAKEL
jgi:hypothetical protein